MNSYQNIFLLQKQNNKHSRFIYVFNTPLSSPRNFAFGYQV